MFSTTITITITGAGFSYARNVSIGGYDAPFTIVSDTSITATSGLSSEKSPSVESPAMPLATGTSSASFMANIPAMVTLNTRLLHVVPGDCPSRLG